MSKNKNATRFYSDKQEKKVAKTVGGRQTSNSGATTFYKGDITNDSWAIECKTCVEPKSSMSVKLDWLTTIKEEAFAMRKSNYAVAIDFGRDENYYIIDEKLFKELVAYKEKENG